MAITAFLSRSPGLLNRGPEGSWDMVLIPASSLQLLWTSSRRGYIIIWRPPTSCERHNFALNSTSRQSRSPLISWYLRPDAPVIYTGAFLLLTAWPGRRSICNTWRTPSLSLLPGPFRLRVVVLVRVPCMSRIELFNHFLYLKPYNSEQTDVCC